jgi:hypothetical protein
LTAVPGIQSVVPIEGVKDLLSMISSGAFTNGLPGVVVPTSESPQARKIDSQHNDRVNVWTCYLVVQKTTTSTPYDVEKLKDGILNALDADQTLGGNSAPTIDAETTSAVTIEDGTYEYVVVTFSIKAHTLIDVPLIT